MILVGYQDDGSAHGVAVGDFSVSPNTYLHAGWVTRLTTHRLVAFSLDVQLSWRRRAGEVGSASRPSCILVNGCATRLNAIALLVCFMTV